MPHLVRLIYLLKSWYVCIRSVLLRSLQQRHDDGVVGNGVVRNAFVSHLPKQHDRGAEVLFVPVALDPAASGFFNDYVVVTCSTNQWLKLVHVDWPPPSPFLNLYQSQCLNDDKLPSIYYDYNTNILIVSWILVQFCCILSQPIQGIQQSRGSAWCRGWCCTAGVSSACHGRSAALFPNATRYATQREKNRDFGTKKLEDFMMFPKGWQLSREAKVCFELAQAEGIQRFNCAFIRRFFWSLFQAI